MFKRIMVVITLVVLAGFTFESSIANAEVQKVGVLNLQKVLLESKAGRKAKDVFEKRMKELQGKFKAEQESLVALQKEIEKKSSAWSKDKKASKIRELQLGQRELQVKSEDAQKELEPILKMLQTVVDSYGQKNGFSVILDSKVAVLYADPSTDVSAAVKSELDKRMK